jgi:hypothetical protein
MQQSNPIQKKSWYRDNQLSKSILQRDLVNEGDAAIATIKSEDVVYELMAHKLAYKGIDGIPDEMGNWLENQGYERQWLGTVKGSGLFCGLIMPKEESEKKPVLTFKGTDKSKTGDVLADVDPIAVGFTAFKLKQQEIGDLIRQAGEKIVVTGHSLGGALAQHAASAFTGSISKVITFQAPGISQEQVRQFNNNVNQMEEDERPEVAHHIATHDVVDLAGGKHLGGSGFYTGKGNAQFYLHDVKGLFNHTKFLLQDQAFQQQQQEVGIDQAARDQVGLRDSQIGQHQNVKQFNDNPFAGNQFIFERGREFASPGAALALGGKEILTGGKGLAKQGLQNWRRGGLWNATKGIGQMVGGGITAGVGGITAGVGAIGALGGALVGGLGGLLAVGTDKTIEGIGEGLTTGMDIGSSPGNALMDGGLGLIDQGRENWREGGWKNKVKGAGKIIGGGLSVPVGALASEIGGTLGGLVGAPLGAISGIPRSLWKRWKQE